MSVQRTELQQAVLRFFRSHFMAPAVFDYSVEQWKKLEESLEALKPDYKALDALRYQLRRHACYYVHTIKKKPESKAKATRMFRKWKNVEKRAGVRILVWEKAK